MGSVQLFIIYRANDISLYKGHHFLLSTVSNVNQYR
ncbi:hypothetical protein MED222_05785 [Vibrio sp. MED222]|nr:hypothetical protein MED222_05785 [Vibrio sp. MED222]